jgi:predicted  nucleic acid-binding Zn-ribbon protein
LIEERQRCDALVNDNDSMLRLLEETRTQKLQIENNFKENFQIQEQQIEQLNSQINFLQDQLENEVWKIYYRFV